MFRLSLKMMIRQPSKRGQKVYCKQSVKKNWDELDKLVVIVTEQIDKETGNRRKNFHFADDTETKEKVISRFKRTYSVLKPGKIISVAISEKDKTIARIEYKHEDRDGFRMVQVNGEWYYMLEYLR